MANSERAFTALGDPTRRRIFEVLSAGPRAVVDIADEFPVTRPAVSQHLKVLMQAGLVKVHREGTRRLYEIDPNGVLVMREYLDSMWNVALQAFKRAAEKKGKK